MEHIIDVNTGEVFCGGRDTKLFSVAIGSCIAVAIYCPEKVFGGIAHVMLPGKAPDDVNDKTRFAEDAIDELFRLLEEAGCKTCSFQVYLVGAGNVLEKHDDTICLSNIESVKKIFKEKNIYITASVLGGIQRKSMTLKVNTGQVSYTIENSKPQPLLPGVHIIEDTVPVE